VLRMRRWLNERCRHRKRVAAISQTASPTTMHPKIANAMPTMFIAAFSIFSARVESRSLTIGLATGRVEIAGSQFFSDERQPSNKIEARDDGPIVGADRMGFSITVLPLIRHAKASGEFPLDDFSGDWVAGHSPVGLGGFLRSSASALAM
jgi:hypothetical protein